LIITQPLLGENITNEVKSQLFYSSYLNAIYNIYYFLSIKGIKINKE